MAPGRQRTFDLVPTTLVKSSGYKPPMTSKAAKKAYQQANRGPRISRAEQRRLDAEELDNQRKEYEREKASIRARAAREKKAEKANAERNERRKLGIPEPSRFVRASQTTISRFVKSNGKRTWQEMDSIAEDSEGTVCDEKDQGELRPAEKQAAMDEEKHLEALAPKNRVAVGVEANQEVQPPVKRAALDEESEDEFGEFPSLSQSDILEKIDSSMISIHGAASKRVSAALKAKKEPNMQKHRDSPELPIRRLVQDGCPFDDPQVLEDMANTQLLSEAAEAASISDEVRPPIPTRSPRSVYRSQPRTSVNCHSGSIYQRPSVPSRPALEDRSGNMPPPPQRFLSEGKSISLPLTLPRPRFPSRNATRAASRQLSSLPPSSTQAFLEDNLDDFLPSPSQELRELLSDVDGLPTNTQTAAQINPTKPKCIPHAQAPYVDENYDDLVCTQDLILSLQDLQEISSVKQELKPKPTLQDEAPYNDELFDGIICTQDFILSLQDLQEIDTPGRAQQKAANNLQADVRQLLSENPTEEESKTRRVPIEKPREKPRWKGRFFEEKEEDLILAAMHESRITAEREAREARETFSKEETKKVPLKGENGREKRTLQRVQSAATDYGDDDFEGFSEQDLLALC
jgi:hypothetical protein